MVCPTSDQPTDVTSDDPAKEGYLYRDELVATFLSVAVSQSQSNSDDSDHDPLNLLSETEEAEVLQSELVHKHLPKLDDMGYISWNQATNKISKGPNWDDIAPILKLMYDNQDELPDGWL